LLSFFIWEGNTMYLTWDAVVAILRELKDGVPAFAISFDYMDEAVVARTTGDPQVTAFVERFAAVGAPWHCGIDDLPALAKEAGLAIGDVAKVSDLHRTYWPGASIHRV
jgi:O-methyltransferase involved in polyketide biosynthesis